MRYLKTYKVFEGRWKRPDIRYLEDICQGLNDDGFDVVVFDDGVKISVEVKKIIISVDSPGYKLEPVLYSSVKDTFNMMVNYMESEGYDSEIHYLSPRSLHADIKPDEILSSNLWYAYPDVLSDVYMGFRIKFCKI